ncbi:hypothetical protein KCX82_06360 [Clostridiales bacterium BAD-6]|uniref:Uncharacterized protein n=2 Tax=Sinanaerobacter chloroacetimidivorans TaxID=2818044 RepID=A0A8J7W235_9FIRM|nr:hypothetical protein [Sinanaerobacter chloroacetimidivorans]
MLPITIELSKNVIEKINNNVYYMIDLLLTDCEAWDYETFLIEIFPPFCVRNSIDVCKNIVFELKEMTRDSYKREYLKPIYGYALFMLIEWWVEVTAEMEGDLLEQISLEDIDAETTFVVDDEDDFDVLDYLNDVDNYKAILFEDFDFLDIPQFFEQYKENPQVCEKIFSIDLDEYTDLMPDDIKEQYEQLRQENASMLEKDSFIDNETYIIRSVYNLLQLYERRSRFFNKQCSEVDFSDSIHDSLKQLFLEKGLYIEREARAGYSKVGIGELDFYLYKYENGIYKPIAVGENKEWGNFEKSIKQLIGYMDSNILFGFTIIYNKSTRIGSILKSRLNTLKSFNINNDFRIIGDIEEVEGFNNVLKTKHENPEHKGTYFYLYHFIYNAYRPERELAAKEARTRKKKASNSGNA